MPSDELTPAQERRVEQVLRANAAIEEARRRADQLICDAVRKHGIPVRVLADRMNYTRQNIYARVRKGLTRST